MPPSNSVASFPSLEVSRGNTFDSSEYSSEYAESKGGHEGGQEREEEDVYVCEVCTMENPATNVDCITKPCAFDNR